MEIINPDALEIEDIFDISNVLKGLGYSDQEVDSIQKRMLDHFWVSYRFIKFSLLYRFRPGAKKYLNYLIKQGFIIEIHSSRAKTCEQNIIGMIARAFSIWQCRLNGIFLRRNQFFFYSNDNKKIDGILKNRPVVAFDDKPEIVDKLADAGAKVICVSGIHNKAVLPSRNVEIVHGLDRYGIEQKMEKMLGKSNFLCQKREACSAKFFNKLSFMTIFLKIKFRPLVLHPENIISPAKKGIIYAPNHRSTLDPLVIESILAEHIHWVALVRFFRGEDSIFNNSKNPILCNITKYIFKRLEYFPIERKKDNQNANNLASLKDMNLFLKNGYKIGIFAEGTTKRPQGQDFGEFDDAFLRIAKKNGAWIQPITLIWMDTYHSKGRVIVNFGKPFQMKDMNINEGMVFFIKCLEEGIKENKILAEQLAGKNYE